MDEGYQTDKESIKKWESMAKDKLLFVASEYKDKEALHRHANQTFDKLKAEDEEGKNIVIISVEGENLIVFVIPKESIKKDTEQKGFDRDDDL